MLNLVNTINNSDMVNRLVIFAKEITKVTREVGMEGKLGFQSEVENV
jgi:hypothetical protein